MLTDEHNKLAYVTDMGKLLDDDRLRYAQEFVCSPRYTRGAVCTEFEAQLRRFRRNVINPRDKSLANPKIVLSGKTNSQGDDILLSVMIAFYFSMLNRHDPQFVARCEEHGRYNF